MAKKRRKMGPTISFKDGEDYIFKLQALGDASEDIFGNAIYPAAGLVADEIQKEISNLKTSKDGQGSLNAIQRAGLHEGLGIAPQRHDGNYLNVKIGWNIEGEKGYNDIKTKRWPNGQPNQMLARSVERGTTFWKPNPFVKRAVARTRNLAQEEMEKVVEREIKKIMEKE